MAEAMALAKPVIATGYSGNLDFMSSETAYLVPWKPIPVPPGCDPYPVGALWADPDLDAAAQLMRQVASTGRKRSKRAVAPAKRSQPNMGSTRPQLLCDRGSRRSTGSAQPAPRRRQRHG